MSYLTVKFLNTQNIFMKADIILDTEFLVIFKYSPDTLWEKGSIPENNKLFILQNELEEKLGISNGNFGCGAKSGGAGLKKTVSVLHHFLFGWASHTDQLIELVKNFPTSTGYTKQPIRVTIDLDDIKESESHRDDY